MAARYGGAGGTWRARNANVSRQNLFALRRQTMA